MISLNISLTFNYKTDLPQNPLHPGVLLKAYVILAVPDCGASEGPVPPRFVVGKIHS